MVTFNVETDLDIANGARGEIIKIILDQRESSISMPQSIVNLEYPPARVLIKLLNTNISQLARLEKMSYLSFHWSAHLQLSRVIKLRR